MQPVLFIYVLHIVPFLNYCIMAHEKANLSISQKSKVHNKINCFRMQLIEQHVYNNFEVVEYKLQ